MIITWFLMLSFLLSFLSASAVWALSVEGDVYRRHGITQNNYIGDYWKKIPGSVEALTGLCKLYNHFKLQWSV